MEAFYRKLFHQCCAFALAAAKAATSLSALKSPLEMPAAFCVFTSTSLYT